MAKNIDYMAVRFYFSISNPMPRYIRGFIVPDKLEKLTQKFRSYFLWVLRGLKSEIRPRFSAIVAF